MAKIQREPRSDGVREGVARSLSQALVYGLESQKTLQQIHGDRCIPKLSLHGALNKSAIGMATSCVTAGLVFYSYFSVYNAVIGTPLAPIAGCLAAFTTSFIKLPIGNSMRLMHSGAATNIISAGNTLYKQNRLRGLYSGYKICLFEDIIEMDVKLRIYKGLSKVSRNMLPAQPPMRVHTKTNKTTTNQISKPEVATTKPAHAMVIGAFAGAIASSLTTPFDTIRAHMCMESAKCTHVRVSPIATATRLCKQHGAAALFRGLPLRAASNALKSAAYFTVFELLTL